MATQEYLTPAQAVRTLGVSKFIFNKRIRPQLTEIRHGPRTVVFSRIELDAYLAQSEAMFKKKTVRDALDHTWEVHWKHNRETYKKGKLKDCVAREIGDDPLSTLDYNRFEQWFTELRDRDLSVDTIKARKSCLSTALDFAVKKGWMKSVPPFPKLKGKGRRLRYLLDDPDEEEMLLKACGCLRPKECDVMTLVLIFMVDTGARLSELLKLRWRDVKEERVIFEDRKAGDKLGVPLTPRAKEAVDALLSNRYWLARVRGADVSPTRCRSAQNWVTHRMGKIRDAAKLYDVHCHTLRHTFASRLVQAGVSLYIVRDLMGHASITQTEVYAHLAPKAGDSAINVLANRKLPNKVTRMRNKSH